MAPALTPIFVLSAGRTGTVFLTHTLPAAFPQLVCAHEPPGSRLTLVLANARDLTGIGAGVVRARVRRSLARARVGPGQRYVEVNPMLCPAADLLGELPDLEVVHLSREPASWVRSILAFRASPRFRPWIERVPLANPAPAPRPPGWWRMDRVERALWRWQTCNARLAALEPVAARYTHLRHEDLFGAGEARRVARRRLADALGLVGADLDALPDEQPINPAPPAAPIDVPDALLERICGPLARRLGHR